MCVGEEGQKLALRAKVWPVLSTPTPDFEYSPTHFLKKFVFPWRFIFYLFKWVGGFLVSAGQPGVTHSDNIDCLNPIHKYIGIEK